MWLSRHCLLGDHGRSKYMRLFLSRICQNTSCDGCHYRKPPRIADNSCIVRSSTPHPKRAEFFVNLDKYTLDRLIKMYCPFPLTLERAYIRVRGMLGRIKRKAVG